MNLAIILARSGSKRIKKKNIRKFINKPIIYYSIEAIKKSNIFDKIHISTDSKEIANIVERKNIKIDFLRPERLSKDNTGSLQVIKWILNQYKRQGLIYENIFNVFACSPLIDHSDLLKAFAKYKKFKKKFPLYVVAKHKVPIEWSLVIDKNVLKPRYPKLINKNSNKFKERYYETGPFTIFNRNHILEKNKIFKEFYPIYYELPQYKAVDIDNLDDWKFAEVLFKGNKR